MRIKSAVVALALLSCQSAWATLSSTAIAAGLNAWREAEGWDVIHPPPTGYTGVRIHGMVALFVQRADGRDLRDFGSRWVLGWSPASQFFWDDAPPAAGTPAPAVSAVYFTPYELRVLRGGSLNEWLREPPPLDSPMAQRGAAMGAG
ncbi:MAG: hypothetical protein JO171_15895 [Paludibacterium sp.]|uniref:hypothetical protein n=1 Tax=Paludibacterium sp. TaxID=1917523 RepID=UPI0025CDE8EF|nr:hypothetical protein [Paludibacterium sp.]MBV8048631.1 hypothetical protein [Paludibacterium sp.]MBV8649113.1 hypothetical protein [Paludibacterium sp.]